MRQQNGWRWAAAAALGALLVSGLAAVPVQAQSKVVLNPDGGQGVDDGLRVVLYNGRHQVQRNGQYQIYRYGDETGYTGFILDVREPGDADVVCSDNGQGCPERLYVSTIFSMTPWTVQATEELPQPDADTWAGRQILRSTTPTNTFTLIYTLTYTRPNPYIDVAATVSAQNTVNGPMHLYYASDLSLDQSDYGPGFLEDVGGNRLWGQYKDSPAPGAFSGLLEDSGSPVSSLYLGYYLCAGQPYETSPGYEGCSTGGPGGDINTYSTPSAASLEEVDQGMGVHWELAATRQPQTVHFRLVYSSYEEFTAFDWAGLPSLAPVAAPEAPIEEPIAQCDELPDLAVSPQLIELTAGGTAQIEVALRNLCKDKPFNSSDLLLSLSDGLVVTDVPAGWLNLGQRAAWQGLSLAPDETKRAVITVSAPNGVPADPQHITELYYKGGVAKRIDGVFITPAPAAAAPAAVVAPAAPAAAAPLPAALPNTGGPLLPLVLPAVAGVALLAAGAARRRN